MISRYPGLRNLLADQIANHMPTRARTAAFELEDCGGAQVTIKRKMSFTEREALSGPPTRHRQPEGYVFPVPALSADALPQVRSAEFAKAKNLAPDLVNDGDDLSERS